MRSKTYEIRAFQPGEQIPDGWKPLNFKHQFVETGNDRRFLTMMENLRLGTGEGRFGVVWDQAGRGKTRAAATWASRRRAPFLRMLPIWRKGSERGFLRALLKELQVVTPPHSIHDCYFAVLDKLLEQPAESRIVFLDEMDLAPERLDLVRSLADLTGCAFVLIGEEGMPSLMERDRRLWSRTQDLVRFEAVAAQEIMAYGWAAARLKIEPAAAELLNQALGGGDWRIIRNRTIKLTSLANANKTASITLEMARLVLEEEQRSRQR